MEQESSLSSGFYSTRVREFQPHARHRSWRNPKPFSRIGIVKTAGSITLRRRLIVLEAHLQDFVFLFARRKTHFRDVRLGLSNQRPRER